MRFVLAIVSFVIAALMIGYGIAQRTILAEPDEVVASLVVSTDAPVTVVDGKALNAFGGSQSLDIGGSGSVFAAYGRTVDVLAWIGDTSYNAVTYNAETGELASELVRGSESEVPDPNGSDLWLDDYVKDKKLSLTVNVPEDISFIIVSDGVLPAPARISLAWPLDNSTPWSGPLIAGGALLLLAGLGFLLWALTHTRRARGPRRKQPKMPKLPRPPRYRSIKRSNPKAIERATTGRRSTRRSMIAVIPMVLVGTLALGGCSAGSWPDFGAASTPSPSPTSAEDTGSELEAPAVSVRQIERIVARISALATEADTNRDAALIATRFDGPALALRTADYVIRAADPAIAPLPAIPAGAVTLTLPQQSNSWPRTVFAVIQDDADATIAPVALFLIQEEARSDYKVNYAMTLEPSAVLPDVAPASVGAARLSQDIKLLAMTPSEIALAYGDILDVDTESPHFLSFEAEGDSLRLAVGLAKKNEAKAGLSSTATMSFSHAVGTGQTIALATNDSGALVAVSLNEITTVAPVEAGAAVNPTGAVKALSGIGVSIKGVQAVYGDQLLFYVPSASSGGKIILLGYSQGLIAASEI